MSLGQSDFHMHMIQVSERSPSHLNTQLHGQTACRWNNEAIPVELRRDIRLFPYRVTKVYSASQYPMISIKFHGDIKVLHGESTPHIFIFTTYVIVTLPNA